MIHCFLEIVLMLIDIHIIKSSNIVATSLNLRLQITICELLNMVRKKLPWSTETDYRSPSIKEIKEFFGKNIYEVPAGATLEDIIDALDRNWPEKTLDLENWVPLPRSQKEILFHKLGFLESDTENIIYSNEKDWNRYGNFWEIRPEEFNKAGSNLLKDAWPNSLRKRKEFLGNVKKSHVDEGIPFEPRFRYDAVEQVDNGIYNVWDYMTPIKGGAKFYNDHCRGEHFDIEPDGNNRWIVQMPSDRQQQGESEKKYKVVIEYPEKKQRAMRYYTGSCECPDYRSKKRKNVNPICKHQISAVAELAGYGVKLDEILPFPIRNAFRVHEKVDCMLYPGGKKTDTSEDAIIRAYIDYKINDINSMFTTNPAYARNLHRSYHTFSI